MLDDVGRGIDDAGHEQHPRRERVEPERLQLVLMPRAGQRERQRAHVGAIDDRQEWLERDVVGVRSVVVSPAEVQAHAIGRDVLHRVVDGVDVEGDGGQEAVERLVLEEAGALHGQVRTVELEHEAAADDQLVLLAHLASERAHVALVRAVIVVEHDRGDDTRRRRRHERLGEPLAPARAALEQLALGHGFAEVGVGHLGDRLGGVVDAGGAGARARQPRQVVRVVGHVA